MECDECHQSANERDGYYIIEKDVSIKFSKRDGDGRLITDQISKTNDLKKICRPCVNKKMR